MIKKHFIHWIALTLSTALTIFISCADSGVSTDLPPIIDGGQTFTVIENSPINTNFGTVSASDDQNTLIFAIIDGNIDDAFDINSDTGDLTTLINIDYETVNTYTLLIEVTDSGGNITSKDIVVEIENVGPTFSLSSIDTVDKIENTATTEVIHTASAIGEGTIIYTLSGDDADDFGIHVTRGELTFRASPDHESPADEDMNNVYNIIIIATAIGEPTNMNFTINVTDVPIGFANSTTNITVNENTDITTVVYQANVLNPDASDTDMITYALSGDDAANFDINASSGEIAFATIPDYEKPNDNNGDRVYDLIITATKGSQMVMQIATFSLIDLIEFGSVDLPAVINQEFTAGDGKDYTYAGRYRGMHIVYSKDELNFNNSSLADIQSRIPSGGWKLPTVLQTLAITGLTNGEIDATMNTGTSKPAGITVNTDITNMKVIGGTTTLSNHDFTTDSFPSTSTNDNRMDTIDFSTVGLNGDDIVENYIWSGEERSSTDQWIVIIDIEENPNTFHILSSAKTTAFHEGIRFLCILEE